MSDAVRRLKEDYENSLDDAETKRAAYHAGIRRLYMGGMTLREIAQLFHLSDQRINKIVGIEPPKRTDRRQGSKEMLLALLVLTALGIYSVFIAFITPRFSSEFTVSAFVESEISEQELLHSIERRIGSIRGLDITFESTDQVLRRLREAGYPEEGNPLGSFIRIAARDQATAEHMSRVLEKAEGVSGVSLDDNSTLVLMFRALTAAAVGCALLTLTPAVVVGRRLIGQRGRGRPGSGALAPG